MNQKILVLGSSGMLGQAVTDLFRHDPHYEVVAWNKDDMDPSRQGFAAVDVTDFALLRQKLLEVKPDVILNCVAYNAVDLCEENEEAYAKALLLNRDLPMELAEISNDLDAILVHYSTDYVFDGTIEEKSGGGCGNSSCCGGGCHGGGARGYGEGAFPNPLSRYGATKAAGEEVVMMNAKQYYIIRLSKLFGEKAQSPDGKRSFFDVMLEAGKAKEEVQVVDDEKSCFTYAPDLAMATKDLIEDQEQWGIYHLPNAGAVTWYEAVVELYRQSGLATKVVPVTSDAFPRPAKRPSFSALINTKRPPLRRYEVALAEYLSDKK
jgi:dTDP-4-dehydrorhamnose reductase